MTITIELTPEQEEQLRAAAVARGQDLNGYAVTVLTEAAREAGDEVGAWWDSLSDEEREAERVHLARGLADIDAGRTHPAEEVYARIRTKYAPRSAA